MNHRKSQAEKSQLDVIRNGKSLTQHIGNLKNNMNFIDTQT